MAALALTTSGPRQQHAESEVRGGSMQSSLSFPSKHQLYEGKLTLNGQKRSGKSSTGLMPTLGLAKSAPKDTLVEFHFWCAVLRVS